jgi:hypothetical protein
MNVQMAAVVGGVAFLLSLLAGLLGGVPFFDVFLRALFWAAFGFGGALGVEALLKSLVPDLFVPSEPVSSDGEPSGPRSVDITLDEDEGPRRGGFIEEVDQDEIPVSRYQDEPAPVSEMAVRSPEAPAPSPAAPSAEADEEMPEIGSFLDAFKPGATDGETDGEASAPELGEYVPSDTSGSSGRGEVTIDGEVQDPAILAKAVQTVMKRDAQGN